MNIGNGVMANVLTYNGTIPGPEFHLKVGDTVIVHFENHIAHDTGIHWHGIELNNESDGTPLTQNQVAPSGTFLYKFKVTRPGMFCITAPPRVHEPGGYQGLHNYSSPIQRKHRSPPALPRRQKPTRAQRHHCLWAVNMGSVDLCETHLLDEGGNSRLPVRPFLPGDV